MNPALFWLLFINPLLNRSPEHYGARQQREEQEQRSRAESIADEEPEDFSNEY